MDYLVGHYSYFFTVILMCLGLYGLLFKRNLVKKVIGLSILQVSVILFYVSLASKWGATVPVKWDVVPVTEVAAYLNPLPHTLMLTAIVVGVATQGVAFGLLIAIWNRFKALDEDELLQKIGEENG